MRRFWPIALLVTLGCSTDIAAQSLGQLARQEEARRKQVGRGKTLTDGDLPKVPQPQATDSAPVNRPAPGSPSATPTTPAPAERASTSDVRTNPPVDGANVPEIKNPRDETYWRDRAREINGHLRRVRADVTAVEGRLAELESLPGSKSDYQVTKAALAKLRQEMQFMSDEWRHFEEKARTAKVPPEWLQ